MADPFNNFEQGLLIACALACTGSVFWLAIVMGSASLRTIDITHHLRRIAEALEERKSSDDSTSEDK